MNNKNKNEYKYRLMSINLLVMRARDIHRVVYEHASRFLTSKSMIAAKLDKRPP